MLVSVARMSRLGRTDGVGRDRVPVRLVVGGLRVTVARSSVPWALTGEARLGC